MNPFENILIEDRFLNNSHSPNYGRYRLSFNQVAPFIEPLRHVLSLKINDPERASILYDLLPDHLYGLIQFDRCEDEEGGFVFEEDDEYLLHFFMLHDFIYIAMENFYFAVQELAEVLEDCHFFIYSTGDDDNRWLDEYKIENGRLSFFNRNMCNDHIYTGRLDFYTERAKENLDDYTFVRFALGQLYDRLHFWKMVPHRTAGHTLTNTVQKSIVLDKMNQYYKIFYSLDKDCPDWYSMNEKYKLCTK